jgi:predicted acyl esterase
VAPPGAALRVDVSGARFPAYDRNPHTACVPVAQAGRADTVVATLEIADVTLELPVAGRGAAATGGGA